MDHNGASVLFLEVRIVVFLGSNKLKTLLNMMFMIFKPLNEDIKRKLK